MLVDFIDFVILYLFALLKIVFYFLVFFTQIIGTNLKRKLAK